MTRVCKAFTLIELLVVISIISILISILLPALAKARMSARTVQCASNLHGFAMAMEAYKSDNRDFYPAALNDSVSTYTGQNDAWGAVLWDKGYVQTGIFNYPDNDLQGNIGGDTNPFHCPQIKQNVSSAASMALTMGYRSNNVPVNINTNIASYGMNVTTGCRIMKTNSPYAGGGAGGGEIWTNSRDYNLPSAEAFIMESSYFSTVGWFHRSATGNGGWVPHSGSTNILYHDGHVTLTRQEDIPDPKTWRAFDHAFWSKTLWTQHQ
jgi:prepilin-type N-terminal cleavage/methylation domain-containing protein/prepilin-type processing-associated H-X9-DG protein